MKKRFGNYGFLGILIVIFLSFSLFGDWHNNGAILSKNIEKPMSYSLLINNSDIYIFFSEINQKSIKMTRSRDSGSYFSEPKIIIDRNENQDIVNIRNIMSLVDIGKIYIFWIEQNSKAENILFSKVLEKTGFSKAIEIYKTSEQFDYRAYSKLGSIAVIINIKDKGIISLNIYENTIKKPKKIITSTGIKDFYGFGDIFSKNILWLLKSSGMNIINQVKTDPDKEWVNPSPIRILSIKNPILSFTYTQDFDSLYIAYAEEDSEGIKYYYKDITASTPEFITELKVNSVSKSMFLFKEDKNIKFFTAIDNSIVLFESDNNGITWNKKYILSNESRIQDFLLLKAENYISVMPVKLGSSYNFLFLTDKKIKPRIENFTKQQEIKSYLEDTDITGFNLPQKIGSGKIGVVVPSLEFLYFFYVRKTGNSEQLFYKKILHSIEKEEIKKVKEVSIFSSPHIYDLSLSSVNGKDFLVWSADIDGNLEIYASDIPNIIKGKYKRVSFSQEASIKPDLCGNDTYISIVWLEKDRVIQKCYNFLLFDKDMGKYNDTGIVSKNYFDMFLNVKEIKSIYANNLLHIFILTSNNKRDILFDLNKPINSASYSIIKQFFSTGKIEYINPYYDNQNRVGLLYFFRSIENSGIYTSLINGQTFLTPELIISGLSPRSPAYIVFQNNKKFLLWNDLRGEYYSIFYTEIAEKNKPIKNIANLSMDVSSLFVNSIGNSIVLTFLVKEDIYYSMSDNTAPKPLVWSDTHIRNMISTNHSPHFQWETGFDPSGIDGYGYVLDNIPNTEVSIKSVEFVIKETRYKNLTNGRYFFHVASVDRLGNWSETAHFPLIINSDVIEQLSDNARNSYFTNYKNILKMAISYKLKSVENLNMEKLALSSADEKNLIKEINPAEQKQENDTDFINIKRINTKEELKKEIDDIVKDTKFKPIEDINIITVVKLKSNGQKEIQSLNFEEYKKELKTSVGSKDIVYTINKGDTLHEIAYNIYKNYRFFLVIAKYNNIPANHLNLIYPGDKINLPSIDKVKSILESNEYQDWIKTYLVAYKKNR